MDQYTRLGEIQSSTLSYTQTTEYENTLRRLKESPLHSLHCHPKQKELMESKETYVPFGGQK